MITIERAGVINFENGYETRLKVNQDNILDELDEAISKANPPKDYNGAFAGWIKIEVGFYPEDVRDE